MPSSPPVIQTVDQQKALRSVEAALARIQRYAEAAASDHITPGEAIEQILDELAVCSTRGHVRAALARHPNAVTAH